MNCAGKAGQRPQVDLSWLQDVLLPVENTTQHNLTAPTEDVFELTTHS